MSVRLFPFVLALGSAATLSMPGSLDAQSRGRVLTPPRPADTARARAPGTTASSPAGQTPGSSAGGTAASRPAPIIARSPVLDSIREAVFRNLLERDRTGLASLASGLCLGLSADDFKKPANVPDQVDPPSDMVQRLYSQRVPARRASACTFTTTGARGKSVPGRPLLYSVGAINELDSGRYEVAASYYYDGAGGGAYTITVERTDAGWAVKHWRSEWTAMGQ